MKNYLLLAALLLACINTFSQRCPVTGSATTEKEMELNRKKNKAARAAAHTRVQVIPIRTFINRGSRPDENLFMDGAYVTVTGGYLVSQEEEGGESCNCNRATVRAKNGDIHIYIGLVPDAPIKNCMVVEITPSWKRSHADYNIASLVGKQVNVTGYLLFDYLHKGNAVNSCQSCGRVWRKTCWEVHPVVEIAEAE